MRGEVHDTLQTINEECKRIKNLLDEIQLSTRRMSESLGRIPEQARQEQWNALRNTNKELDIAMEKLAGINARIANTQMVEKREEQRDNEAFAKINAEQKEKDAQAETAAIVADMAKDRKAALEKKAEDIVEQPIEPPKPVEPPVVSMKRKPGRPRKSIEA